MGDLDATSIIGYITSFGEIFAKLLEYIKPILAALGFSFGTTEDETTTEA